MNGRAPSAWVPGAVLLLVGFIGLAPATARAWSEDAEVEAAASGFDQFRRVVLLRDYNTRVVVTGALLLGLAAGVLGSFLVLRKRALMGDVISHATLPGIAIAFMLMVGQGGSGKRLGGLLLGAAGSALLGMGCVQGIKRWTRLKEDAALGIVLSVFFGAGVALLGIIQKMSTGSAAGLESFIYGKTASMLASDAWLIAGVAAAVLLLCAALHKEFGLLCFDADFARSLGWPATVLDTILMALVVTVTVIGLQAVGLILIIALLIVPAAAARFWSHRLQRMTLLAGVIGAISGLVGSALSAMAPRWPAGAVIVLVATFIFLVSLLAGTARGVVWRARDHWSLQRTVGRQHLLRALYERLEATDSAGARSAEASSLPAVSASDLRAARTWAAPAFARYLRRALRSGEVEGDEERGYRLTPSGLNEARRIVRNHRLWELYLIRYADIAPSHVDRDADEIEHVLGSGLVAELEAELPATQVALLPASPHPMGGGRVA
jgi:manganese/zinc/iron transport system permease protein